MGLYSSANQAFGEEKKLLEKMEKRVSAKDFFSAAFSCQLLAKMAADAADMEASVRYTELAIRYGLLDQKFHAAGWLYRALADLYIKKGEYSKAIENAAKSAELFLKENSKYAAQWSYNLAAKAAEEEGKFYTAIRYFKKSLEIEGDNEIEKKVASLKKKIPHPLVFVLPDKITAKEGEDLEFKISVENTSCEPLKNLKVSGVSGDALQEIGLLSPHEEKTLAVKATASMGFRFPCRTVSWENALGDKFDQNIEPAVVTVIPKVDVFVSCNQPIRLNKPSDFIILVKNNSSTAIHHIEASAKFPEGVVSAAETKTHLENIFPGEERGFAFSITPKTVGSFEVSQIKVLYKDDYGIRHEDSLPPFKIKEAVEEPIKNQINAENTLSKEDAMRLKILEGRKGKLKINPHPISEEEYLKLTKYYASAETGYTLDHISIGHVTSHVLDACEPLALISSMDFEDEKLFLFSGIEFDRVYLLTVALKKDGDLTNVLFKAYANTSEGLQNFLENMSQIVSYSSMILSSAKEVEKIEVNQVIKIIDSVVQRSQIGNGSAKNKKSVIKGSVVQRTGEI